MNENLTRIEKIPRSKEAIKDMVIAGAFIAMGLLLPGALIDSDFQSHLGGIALGIGLGWLVKSFIHHQSHLSGVNDVNA